MVYIYNHKDQSKFVNNSYEFCKVYIYIQSVPKDTHPKVWTPAPEIRR